METTKPLTVERLGEVLSYEPEMGLFRWKRRTSNRVKVGDVAGRMNGNGYIRISIDGGHYYAHRLAWLWANGAWPEFEVDHRDGDRSNNRIENIRQASHAENGQNQALRATNTSGRHGVSWSRQHCKWAAYIVSGGKKRHLGLFDCLDKAASAYLEAKRLMHSFQPEPRDLAHA